MQLRKEHDMEPTFKGAAESVLNYTIAAQKQAYEFTTKMIGDYVEFTTGLMKMAPGFDAVLAVIPEVAKKK